MFDKLRSVVKLQGSEKNITTQMNHAKRMIRIKRLNVIYLVCVLFFCLISESKSEDSIILDNLEDYSNFEKWKTHGGPESSTFRSKEIAHSGDYSLRFKVKVDHKIGGSPEYPVGWLSVDKDFPKDDWSDYKTLEFYLYVPLNQPEGNIKYGIYCEDTKGDCIYNTILYKDIKPGEWRKIILPLNKFTVKGSLNKIVQITFYVAEWWYKDGDELNFYFDDFSLLKYNPVLENAIYLLQTDYFLNEEEALVFYNLVGDLKEIAYIEFTLVDNNGKAVKKDKIEIDTKDPSFTIKIKDLEKGTYKIIANIEDNENKVLYSGSAVLRKISKPFTNSAVSIPYVQCITFYTTSFYNQINDDWINVVNNTPYQGIAVLIGGAYDVNPVPKYTDLSSSIDKLKKNCKKHIWPWIFLNRIMEGVLGEGHDNDPIDPYFAKIKGMDLYNETGALSDFYSIFRLSLKIAKELKSPGITLDYESYNDYRLINFEYLSRRMNRSKEEIDRRLKDIGKEMANIVKEEYPEVCIWSLFIASPDYTQPMDHIIYGLLDEAKKEKIPLKIIEGGEGSLVYIHHTEDELKNDIQKRGHKYSPLILLYPDNFFLGGTICPTDKPEDRTGWIKDKYAGSKINKVEDLLPFFEDIFATYKYVWIYPALATKFNPFSSAGDRYHVVIQQAIDNVSKRNK